MLFEMMSMNFREEKELKEKLIKENTKIKYVNKKKTKKDIEKTKKINEKIKIINKVIIDFLKLGEIEKELVRTEVEEMILDIKKITIEECEIINKELKEKYKKKKNEALKI